MRDFLVGRAQADLGEAKVKRLHLELARAFSGTDWRLVSQHLVNAGHADEIGPLINQSLEQVLARGEYSAAKQFLALGGLHDETSVAVSVVESRIWLQQGDFEGARREADVSILLARDNADVSLATVLLNASGIHHATFSKARALELAIEAAGLATDPYLVVRAKAAASLQEMSRRGDIAELRAVLVDLREYQIEHGQWHFVGITELNLAVCETWLGHPAKALLLCDEALLHIEQSSNGYEAASVEMARSLAYGYLARWPEAEACMRLALDAVHNPSRPEVVADSTLQSAWFGSHDWARSLATELRPDSPFRSFALIVLLTLALDERDEPAIREYSAQLSVSPLAASMEVELFHVQLVLCRAAFVLREPDVRVALDNLIATSTLQASPLQKNITRLLGAILVQ